MSEILLWRLGFTAEGQLRAEQVLVMDVVNALCVAAEQDVPPVGICVERGEAVLDHVEVRGAPDHPGWLLRPRDAGLHNRLTARRK